MESLAPPATDDAAKAAVEPARPPLPLTAAPREKGVGVPNSIQNNFGTDVANEFRIGRPAPGGSSTGVIPAGLDEFYSQSIQWEACNDYAVGGMPGIDDSRFSCGYAIVPLDYADPSGPTIAVSLLKAHSGENEKKGTLLIDPGGPGGSGMETVVGRIDQYEQLGLLEDFDLVGFDPRGVGSSAPVISCVSDATFDSFRESSDLNVLRYYMVDSGCIANTALEYPALDAASFLRSVGTNNVVKDLDVLRSVVGDQRLNYLGYSYGTSIGYNYALAFPENIRAMVLDAIVNPFENNPEEFAKYDEFIPEEGVSQAASGAETRKRFVARCEAEGGFNLNDGEKVACAADMLNTRPTKPVWSESEQRYLGPTDFDWAINRAMYSESLWDDLNAGFADLKNGEDPSRLLALADAYFDRSAEGSYGFGESAFLQITFCADDVIAACNDQATATEPMRKGEAISALTNVLVISGTYDNATAYPNGVVMSKAIGGTLLSVATNSHGSVANRTPITCVDVTASTYLRTLDVVEDPGATGVPTKDIYSNPITGDQCQIDEQWRAIPTTADRTATAGETLQVTASGLTRGGKYTVTVLAADGAVLFQTSEPIVAASDGTISVPFVVKNSADSGEYRIVVKGAEEITQVLTDAVGNLVVTAIVLPTPAEAAISLSAGVTDPTSGQTVFGSGFAPGSDVSLFLDSAGGTALGTLKAGDDGAFLTSVSFTDLEAGEHSIVAVGEDGVSRTASFRVEVAGAIMAGAGGSSSEVNAVGASGKNTQPRHLASTGSETPWALVMVAILLAGAGTALRLRGRRSMG